MLSATRANSGNSTESPPRFEVACHHQTVVSTPFEANPTGTCANFQFVAFKSEDLPIPDFPAPQFANTSDTSAARPTTPNIPLHINPGLKTNFVIIEDQLIFRDFLGWPNAAKTAL